MKTRLIQTVYVTVYEINSDIIGDCMIIFDTIRGSVELTYKRKNQPVFTEHFVRDTIGTLRKVK